MSERWIKVAMSAAVEPGNVLGVKAGTLELAVYNLAGTFHATDNLCTHAYARLSQGWVDGEVVECPLHGGRFEIKSGKGLGLPITCDIRTYPVRVVGGAIEVSVAGVDASALKETR